MPSMKLLLLSLAMASTSCGPRSPSRTPSCPPSLPPVTIAPPAPAVDCRVALGPRLDLTTLQALPRCLTPEGQPMPSADRCWTSGEVSTAAAALARLITSDARVRRCLDLAAGAAP